MAQNNDVLPTPANDDWRPTRQLHAAMDEIRSEAGSTNRAVRHLLTRVRAVVRSYGGLPKYH